MAYYEWQCGDCSVVFECTINDNPPPKFQCVDCQGDNLRLIGFIASAPTALQFLENEVTRLVRRVENLERSIGIDEDVDGTTRGGKGS